jgi:hypothetical protein
MAFASSTVRRRGSRKVAIAVIIGHSYCFLNDLAPAHSAARFSIKQYSAHSRRFGGAAPRHECCNCSQR